MASSVLRLLLLLLVGVAAVARAADDLDALEQRMTAFASGTEAAFSPETTKKAQAYLGAALLARDNHDAVRQEEAQRQAADLLRQARGHADDFRKRYAEMLAWLTEARRFRRYDEIRNAIGPVSPSVMAGKAERALRQVVAADERGDLNAAAQAAREVVKWSKQSVAAALPMIRRMSEAFLSKARAANGRYYAPTLYAAAQRELAEVSGFLDGTVDRMPAHPYHLLRLAVDTQQLTLKVRGWRKKKGSHEHLVLEGRAERRALAQALGMQVDGDDLVTDVRPDRLQRRAEALREQLRSARAALVRQREELEADFKTRLSKALAEQERQLLGSKQKQLNDLKAAFQAKLERETRETRKQAALRKIFKGKDVQVFFNLDGSVLLRLSGLHFPSGRSALAADQLPLLGAVVKALQLYDGRDVRIEGHTDNVGDIKKNRELSTRRAETVRDFLITSGIDAGRLKALGYGEVRPIASNEFAKGRAMNRRIDVVIQP